MCWSLCACEMATCSVFQSSYCSGYCRCRLKAVSVESERVLSTGSAAGVAEKEEGEEESDGGDSDMDEAESTAAKQGSQKKQPTSYQAAGDSDHEAAGLLSEGESEEREEGEREEGEGSEKEPDAEEEVGEGTGPIEAFFLDRDRVNVS